MLTRCKNLHKRANRQRTSYTVTKYLTQLCLSSSHKVVISLPTILQLCGFGVRGFTTTSNNRVGGGEENFEFAMMILKFFNSATQIDFDRTQK